MRSRNRDLAVVTALALLLTAVVAAPVLVAPAERVFGFESVGRHHDPFTVMQQFEQPLAPSVYAQPVTDAAGAVIARFTGGVAAYNWLVLLTFPLAAVTAFLLARHLALSSTSAMFVALAFAFSPFHIAHAAYHPHIAQVQWIPLYFLALWRCLDRASPVAIGVLVLATAAVAFSNFYGGLIAAVMTPFATALYAWSQRPGGVQTRRPLLLTLATLGLIALAGLLWVWLRADAVLRDPSAFAVPASDPFKYSAKWWSYLVPPLAHPWLGPSVRDLWSSADVFEGLLEQQVTIGTGVVLLGVIALLTTPWRFARLSTAPMLALVAAVALIWSLSPERVIAGVTVVRPSALLVHITPMFRSYARFGVVVQLMAVLLAGLGLDALWRSRRAGARLLGVTLILLTVAEYVVLPSAMSRDVMPTAAHRWLMTLPSSARALECLPLSQESASVQWLTRGRVTMSGGTLTDCLEPRFADKLAAYGFTHLVARTDTVAGRALAGDAVPDGLKRVFRHTDSVVFTVTAPPPAIYTDAIDGFSPREHNSTRSWTWMGHDGAWTLVNSQAQPQVVTLSLELEAFHLPRHLQLRLDGQDVATLAVDVARRAYTTTAFTVPPGRHVLAFAAVEAPTVADAVAHNGDQRPLSIAVGDWRWHVEAAR